MLLMFPESRTSEVQTKRCEGNGRASWVSEVHVLARAGTIAALIGHSDVTLPQCWRETKQDMNEALVLQTSLGANAMNPVTLFTVCIANYGDSFSGASLCTLGSLIPSSPSRPLHLTHNLGSHKAAPEKPPPPPAALRYSGNCTAQPATECSIQVALGTDGGGHSVCLNRCAQRLLQCSFGGLSHCNGTSEVETRGRILWKENLLLVVLFWVLSLIVLSLT